LTKKIEITVSPTGEVTVEAHGYQGKGCLEASKEFEQALGKITKRKMKAEAARQTARPTIKAR
jgi:hypothetical protein